MIKVHDKRGEPMLNIRKFCASKVEWKYIYQLIESIEEKKIRNYVANQVEWYVIKAERYKLIEYTLKILTVVMPTLVVIVQQCLDTENPIVKLVVLGGATITSASGTFLKLHDKRVIYRKAAEQIKDETMLYITHSEPYSSEEDRDKDFVMKLYGIAKNTNSKWSEIEEKDNGETNKQDTKETS